MGDERHVRLFRNGRNRAVRIPKELDIFGESVVMRREGQRIVMEAEQRESLAALLDRMEDIDEELPELDDPPPEPIRV